MPDETPASPSESDLLKAELDAITARVSKAAKPAQKRLVAAQYAQRTEHLKARIKALTETPPAS